MGYYYPQVPRDESVQRGREMRRGLCAWFVIRSTFKGEDPRRSYV
jgi:hypothetical protein